jgi:hypothetical protein
MQKKEIAALAQKSVLISDAFSRILGAEAALNERGRLAMAYLSLSLDHREAILLLVHSGAYPSATALQRPLLEAFVSGAWIDACATDKDIQSIMQLKRTPPKFETMSQQLRKAHDLGSWFEEFRIHYNILGDYAHGHRRQLSRWMGPGSIEPRYSVEQMAEVLRHTDLVGIMAAIHREKISGRPTDQLLPLLDEVLKERPAEEKMPPAQ